MVTIRDVADAAGVSTATVSRVFNESARVDAATRKRVVVAAGRLNYWPNGAARSLTTSRSHAIGVLLPDLFGEFFSEVIRGIDQAARRERYQILVSSSHADGNELTAAVRSMNGRIDGLIAMALDKRSAELIRRFRQSFPVVLMNTGFRIRGTSSVSIANFEGAFDMGRHLLKLGHHRLAIVKGPEGNTDAEERLRGFRKAIEDAGRARVSLVEVPGDFSESSGYRAAQTLLKARSRPTAVFAANDYMAVGLMGAFRAEGLRVPDDIAVAGFDDIGMAQYLNPPLTTVHVDAYEEGGRAVRLLLASFDPSTKSSTATEVLATHLVIRRSCGSRAPFEAGVERRPGSRARTTRKEEVHR